MNVTIDGLNRDLGLHPEATFPDVMKAVGQLDGSPGIGITRVKLNGEDITGADWSRLSAVPAVSISALEIETGNVSLLARELLDSLEDFTGRLIGELGRTSESFRVGDQDRAIQIYTRALDGIELLSHTSAMIERNLGLDTGEVVFNGKPSSENFKKLPAVIDDMLSAQQRNDWVLLADLIEYELIPQFEDHQKILRLWRDAYASRRQ